MIEKQLMKTSEARITIYLNQVDKYNRYGMAMSTKLGMDYNYLLRILDGMVEKSWLNKFEQNNKNHFVLTDEGKKNIKIAGKIITEFKEQEDEKQRELS